MNFRPRRKGHSQVESGSLSDILFVLLMFFLMISTMASPDAIKLLLPQASTAKHVENKEVVSLAVDAQGRYFVNNKPVQEADLEMTLKEEATKKGAESVKLSIDKTKSIQDLINVMDIVNRLNLHMVIATEKAKN